MDTMFLNKPVVRLDTSERSVNYKWFDDSNNLSGNLQVVSIDKFEEWCDEGENRSLVPSNCQCGDVIVRHPFRNGVYIRLEDMEDVVYKNKGFIISQIANLLGCTDFSWEVEIGEMSERNISANGSISYKVVAADAEWKKSEERKVSSKLKLEQKSSGGMINIEEAERLAKECNLWQDDAIRTLIECRNPKNPVIKERRVSVQLSSEVNEMCDIAFSLKVTPAFSANFKYSEQVKYKKEVVLYCNILF